MAGMFNTANRKHLGLGICLAATVLIGGCTAQVQAPPQNVSVDSSFERPAHRDARSEQQTVQPSPSEKPSPDKVRKPARATPPQATEPAADKEAPDKQAVDKVRNTNRHRVVAGQTVGEIADLYGVKVTAMLDANGLHADSVIVPGQELKISGPPVAPQHHAAPAAKPASSTGKQAAGPLPAAAPAPAPAPSIRTIPVVASGGQAMIDRCIGPVHYTPLDHHAVFITEHDSCGGWARFSGIVVGETVKVSGYGTYTVTGIGTVPSRGFVSDLLDALGSMPAVVLQTCIPGTTQSRVIALN